MNLFILFGQTATGKTAQALRLVDQYQGEIVNFDSRQIYKRLDIITGKDKPTDPKYKIWLYDIVDPKDIFSSAEYAEIAFNTIKDIIVRGKTPILVGGTGHYLRHILFGTPKIQAKEDWNLRKQLESKTVSELQLLLKEKNSALLESMNNSDRNNPRRLIRRIEIAACGGFLPNITKEESLSSRLKDSGALKDNLAITYLPFFHATTEIVREKIRQRVDARLADGAVQEVENLLKDGYTKDDPGLNAIGYKQIIEYLEHKITLNEAKEQWITKEVQYAKRQKTYFNKYFTK